MDEKTIAVDLDGTLADYTEWKGIGHIGKIKPFAKEALTRLKEMGFKVVLYTTRANPEMEDHEGAKREVIKWLMANDLHNLIDEITGVKLIAELYIDDRAIRYTNWEDALEQVSEITGAV